MSNIFNFGTGLRSINKLQELQLSADREYQDAQQKINALRTRIIPTGISSLLGEQLLFTTNRAYLMGPTTPDIRFSLSGGGIFSGELAEISYMYDVDLPIDMLTLNFTETTPLALGDSVHDENLGECTIPDYYVTSEDIRSRTLQVPVLHIANIARA